MACLGGTVEEPTRWFRYHADGSVEAGEGRTCKRTAPWTTTAGERYPKAWNCGSCVLFRGVSYGQPVVGLDSEDLPTVLSYDEKVVYEAAQEAAFDNDDFIPMDRFVRRMRGDMYGIWWLARNGDPDAMEARAAYQRQHRAAHPERRAKEAADRRANRKANLERERDAARERMRRLRAQRQVNVTPEGRHASL